MVKFLYSLSSFFSNNGAMVCIFKNNKLHTKLNVISNLISVFYNSIKIWVRAAQRHGDSSQGVCLWCFSKSTKSFSRYELTISEELSSSNTFLNGDSFNTGYFLWKSKDHRCKTCVRLLLKKCFDSNVLISLLTQTSKTLTAK